MNPGKVIRALPLLMALTLEPAPASSQEVPAYLRDRGTGMPTSQFGTYIRKGELLVYPFFEYYRDNDLEYEPLDFGFGSTQEYRGRYRASEGLFFIAYGISDRLAAEFEVGAIAARFEKARTDVTAVPARMEKSGLNDVEGQLRYRWNREAVGTPEVFTYFETVFPTGEQYSLIGTSAWEFKLGTGLTKGFQWGTLTFRAAIDYTAAEKAFGPGEYAVEYLKRMSNRLRFFFMVEGTEDEVAVVPEIQWHVGRNLFVKLNQGIGLTSKATDYAPELGLMLVFTLGKRP
ncbi:MAG: hypothetical protein HY560_10385 [Gemmatimonadetes bacterium]|nr:hypothetical protein [Gemmatimonadota bacterium]